jgi:formate/nitrite transporter FocA (FNT family)
MVWMLPAAQQSRVVIIVAVTYVVALGNLSHVVAGAVDVFFWPRAASARLERRSRISGRRWWATCSAASRSRLH